MRNVHRTGLRLLVLAGTLLLPARGLLAADTAIPEKELMERIEKAATPQDHAALASYYRAQAQAAEAKAAEHDTMAKEYAGLTAKGDWASHCRNLASSYRRAAEEYRSLAALEAGQAGEKRSP